MNRQSYNSIFEIESSNLPHSLSLQIEIQKQTKNNFAKSFKPSIPTTVSFLPSMSSSLKIDGPEARQGSFKNRKLEKYTPKLSTIPSNPISSSLTIYDETKADILP
jgi:hypothetical protein